MLAAQPAWAAGPEFDPDQPFLGQALAALDDHLEMSGAVDPNALQGDKKQALRFKFYPNGKSKSDEHITAEGWFGPSTDSSQDEFHFRFAVPKSLKDAVSVPLENVL